MGNEKTFGGCKMFERTVTPLAYGGDNGYLMFSLPDLRPAVQHIVGGTALPGSLSLKKVAGGVQIRPDFAPPSSLTLPGGFRLHSATSPSDLGADLYLAVDGGLPEVFALEAGGRYLLFSPGLNGHNSLAPPRSDSGQTRYSHVGSDDLKGALRQFAGDKSLTAISASRNTRAGVAGFLLSGESLPALEAGVDGWSFSSVCERDLLADVLASSASEYGMAKGVAVKPTRMVLNPGRNGFSSAPEVGFAVFAKLAPATSSDIRFREQSERRRIDSRDWAAGE